MELGLSQEPAGSQAGERPWRGQSWPWAVGTAESSLAAGSGGAGGVRGGQQAEGSKPWSEPTPPKVPLL